jgi:heme-degrading monooxygenase HmoA
MVEIWWEFKAKPERVADFEREYGERGGWARLYGLSPEYRGTTVVREIGDPLHYLLVDRWTSLKAFEDFKASRQQEWYMLDSRCEELTASEKPLGIFASLPAQD